MKHAYTSPFIRMKQLKDHHHKQKYESIFIIVNIRKSGKKPNYMTLTVTIYWKFVY